MDAAHTLTFLPTSEMNTLHSMVLFSISNPVSWTGTFSKLAMSSAHDSVLPAHLGLAAKSPRKLHTHIHIALQAPAVTHTCTDVQPQILACQPMAKLRYIVSTK